MKNILNKININIFTYYFLIICFFCGFIKNAIIIFIIVIIHEIGHIMMIKLCCYNIERLNIYPFGGITTINKLINSSTIKDILISISGVVFQYIIVNIVINIIEFSDNTLNLITLYNKVIVIFNTLPIIPLDGSKLLESSLNRAFPYKTSFYITVITSIISIMLFINYNAIYSVNNYFIISVLIFYTFKYYKDFKYLFNKFLLERILYNIQYKKIDNNTKNINSIKKEYLHYFKRNNKYINERKIIRDKFDKSTYF